MKQTVFETKQRAEELIQKAIEIWRKSDKSDMLEGIEGIAEQHVGVQRIILRLDVLLTETIVERQVHLGFLGEHLGKVVAAIVVSHAQCEVDACVFERLQELLCTLIVLNMSVEVCQIAQSNDVSGQRVHGEDVVHHLDKTLWGVAVGQHMHVADEHDEVVVELCLASSLSFLCSSIFSAFLS